MTYHLIADETALLQAYPRIRSQPRIALDCEAAGFHRYTDRLCLVQVSTPSENFVVDPLAFDPSASLRPLLEDPTVEVVMHGADFDLRLLRRDLGIQVRGLFDTQIAASLLGADAIGLAALLEVHLGVRLSKTHQRADWAQRPLPEGLLEYAAGDTRYLLGLRDILEKALREKERWEWAQEEFHLLEMNAWEEDETDPVTRIKGARHMTPRQFTALRELWKWRDGIARARDRAPFRVVGDSVLVGIVMDRPDSLQELGSLKGISPRLAKSHGKDLLDLLDRVQALPDPELTPYPRENRNGPGRPSPEEEAAAERIRSLRTLKAAELGIDRGVLLSNAQIGEIVRNGPTDVAGLRGLPGMRRWQTQILGRDILKVLGR